MTYLPKRYMCMSQDYNRITLQYVCIYNASDQKQDFHSPVEFAGSGIGMYIHKQAINIIEPILSKREHILVRPNNILMRENIMAAHAYNIIILYARSHTSKIQL